MICHILTIILRNFYNAFFNCSYDSVNESFADIQQNSRTPA